MREIKWIILHCTAGPANQSTSVIQNFWKSKGYKRPGYHHLISADGSIDNLQGIEEKTNGVAGFNAHSIHISYKGGVKDGKVFDTRTDEQKKVMKRLVEKYHTQFPKAIILGHRDFSPDKNRNGIVEPSEWTKACPSFSVKQWLQEEGIVHHPVMPEAKKAVSTKSGSGANLRNGPGINYNVIGGLNDGTVCMVIADTDGWSNVEINDNLKGWIKSEFLK